MARDESALLGTVVRLDALTAEDRRRMHELMATYYEGVDEAQFHEDLSKKCAVILLRDACEGRIQGFSTLATLEVEGHRGIFSGDTVLEQRYWGSTVLGKVFLRHLFLEKLRRPFTPLYWLLISKGYKTYLMMANNFLEHHPRFEAPTPPGKKRLMDLFYGALYPGKYDGSTGLITFPGETMRLRTGVASVSLEALKHPRIAFFQEKNPGWARGDELACMARMTLWMPFQYGLKVIMKKMAPQRKEGFA